MEQPVPLYAAELNKPAAERNPRIKAPAPRTPSGTVAINAQGEFKPEGRTGAIAGSDKSLAACAITRLTRRDKTHVITPTPEEQRNIDATAREARRQNEARRSRPRRSVRVRPCGALGRPLARVRTRSARRRGRGRCPVRDLRLPSSPIPRGAAQAFQLPRLARQPPPALG